MPIEMAWDPDDSQRWHDGTWPYDLQDWGGQWGNWLTALQKTVWLMTYIRLDAAWHGMAWHDVTRQDVAWHNFNWRDVLFLLSLLYMLCTISFELTCVHQCELQTISVKLIYVHQCELQTISVELICAHQCELQMISIEVKCAHQCELRMISIELTCAHQWELQVISVEPTDTDHCDQCVIHGEEEPGTSMATMQLVPQHLGITSHKWLRTCMECSMLLDGYWWGY